MSTSAHDELYPRGEGPFRYRIYRLRAGELEVIAACPEPGGIGTALVAAHEEGEIVGDDRVGVLDTIAGPDESGTWIVHPFTGGRGRRDLKVGDMVESSVKGFGQPYIRGEIVGITRDVATVRVDEVALGLKHTSKSTRTRSLKHLRVVGDGG